MIKGESIEKWPRLLLMLQYCRVCEKMYSQKRLGYSSSKWRGKAIVFSLFGERLKNDMKHNDVSDGCKAMAGLH